MPVPDIYPGALPGDSTTLFDVDACNAHTATERASTINPELRGPRWDRALRRHG